MRLTKVSEGIRKGRRLIGSGLAVDSGLTTPTDVAKHTIPSEDLTAVQVAIEVLSRCPVGEWPVLQKHVDKARILWVLNQDSGLIPIPSRHLAGALGLRGL
jgi:hypothetical protein